MVWWVSLAQPVKDVLVTVFVLAMLLLFLELERSAERRHRGARFRHPARVDQASCVRLLEGPRPFDHEQDS